MKTLLLSLLFLLPSALMAAATKVNYAEMSVINSTWVYLNGGTSVSVTATTGKPCVAGSTVTLTVASPSGLWVAGTGSLYNSNADASSSLGYLLDGSNTLYSIYTQQGASSGNHWVSGVWADLVTVSAGSHTLCMFATVSAGTASFFQDSNLKYNFSVTQLR